MSISEDEDDFLSADEDGFDDNQDNVQIITSTNVLEEKKPTEALDFVLVKKETVLLPEEIEIESKKNVQVNYGELDKGKEKNFVVDEDERNEEEILAEKIRERNLKLARKFSAELAKNVKASAPIPVRTSAPPPGIVTSGFDDSSSTPHSENKVNDPPAPPPTPALSSSFSSFDQNSSTTTTQYGWRIPVKTEPTLDQNVSNVDERSKQALDRLSDRLSQQDKNLFEKVADDIKKVSLKSSHLGSESSESTSTHIPLLSDIGSTFGSWNWNSASKLLATASQVTSQVGSVFDSVINVAQQPNQETSKQAINDENSCSKSLQDKEETTASTNNTNINEALVGFTLNAMESLGKKAFGVMTERDESGSLQIKGLGRPWEHLLNVQKSQHELPQQDDFHQDSYSTQTVELVSKPSDNLSKSDSQSTSLTNRKRKVKLQDEDLD